MTEGKTFKRRVRERMSKTGESYTSARAQVARKRDRDKAARDRLATTDDLASDAVVERETGKGYEEWFAILDAWEARQKSHRDIARHLMDEHAVPGWYAQTITVGYERARGMRVKHQRPTGFEVSASKTIGVPVDVLFDAFVDDAERAKWLTSGTMSLRTSEAARSARFDWEAGDTRVVIWFEDKGPAKSKVSLAHQKLADADDAETMKAMWRERLGELKDLLES
jgi:hypothetical protein